MRSCRSAVNRRKISRSGRVVGSIIAESISTRLPGLLIWLPLILKSFGNLTDIQIGLLSAVPPLLGVIATIVVSWSSDRTGDRKRHLAGVYILAGVAIGISAVAPNATLAYLMLCLTGLGINSGNSLFWSINASLNTGVAGAASIAFVNTVAQFGGLFGIRLDTEPVTQPPALRHGEQVELAVTALAS